MVSCLNWCALHPESGSLAFGGRVIFVLEVPISKGFRVERRKALGSIITITSCALLPERRSTFRVLR
jgi:hypothetical protein